MKKTWLNAAFLIFALYALLAIPFRSVVQPIYVLLAVPFGVIGALLGHLIMDITPNFLSVFGMLALAGVVVNDSLVMVDFVNSRRRAGRWRRRTRHRGRGSVRPGIDANLLRRP